MNWGQDVRVHLRLGLALAIVAPLVTACGDDAKRTLGWEKSAPDEFSVLTRAPLAQPPDYDLRPPSETAAQAPDATTERAKKVLISAAGSNGSVLQPKDGKDNAELASLSPGEMVLLKKAGAEGASGTIRKQVDEETTQLVQESKSFTDDLMFWQKKPQPGEIVDPVKEQQRLEVNASLGQSATEGETPQIVRRQKGWLEDIF
jgi:hypothetical protein